ncbi:MAG: glycosyltransferase family 4 protein [Balneolaceae bacterium]|nr:MAG: glycosyltransferase family 4 protein [Balneolaceae bacterium]
MINISLLVIAAIVFIANYLFTGWYIGFARKNQITDIPTERSSHSKPTPRGGGIGFVFTSIIAIILYALLNGYLISAGLLVFISAAVIIALMGWLDDKFNLSRRVRFFVQAAAAFAVLYFMVNISIVKVPMLFEINIGVAGFLLGIIFLSGATNIYNFMDGVDGIASVQLFGVTIGWMILSWIWHEPLLFSINLILFVAVLAFLRYNWSPAKVFMGDAGSLYLGFFCASMPFIAAYQSEVLNIQDTIWYGIILLWPFLFDGTFTLVRRFSNGENIFEAHRSHLYQRLNIIGVSHANISLLYLSFSAFMTAFVILFAFTNDFYKLTLVIIILFLSLVYVSVISKKELAERNSQKN